MKILGGIIIICTCWIIGLDFYKMNLKRLSFTKDLYNGIECLKSEIVYSCDFLSKSILKCTEFSGEAALFMQSVGNKLEEKGTSCELAFDKSETLIVNNVSNETYMLTRDLFMQLGEKDCENQENLIDGYLHKLSCLIKKQTEFCCKECVIFKKTGAIIGIGIAILLI